MLSDFDIKRAIRSGQLDVWPAPEEEAIQPASLDLTLGSEFAIWKDLAAKLALNLVIDPADEKDPGWPLMEKVKPKEYIELPPKSFALGTTAEKVRLGPQLAARVEGRSTLGRLGLMVHATAGFIDPGFHGNITLELYNLSPFPFRLRPGMSVCQLALARLETQCAVPYGYGRESKYQGQAGVRLPEARKGRI